MAKIYYLYAGIAVQLVFSFILSIAGFWYLSFIPAVIAGFLVKKPVIAFLYSGFSSAIGVFISIIYYEPSYRFARAALFSGIAGIGGGIAFPLLTTIIVMFVLGGSGALLGSSVSLSKKETNKTVQ